MNDSAPHPNLLETILRRSGRPGPLRRPLRVALVRHYRGRWTENTVYRRLAESDIAITAIDRNNPLMMMKPPTRVLSYMDAGLQFLLELRPGAEDRLPDAIP